MLCSRLLLPSRPSPFPPVGQSYPASDRLLVLVQGAQIHAWLRFLGRFGSCSFAGLGHAWPGAFVVANWFRLGQIQSSGNGEKASDTSGSRSCRERGARIGFHEGRATSCRTFHFIAFWCVASLLF